MNNNNGRQYLLSVKRIQNRIIRLTSERDRLEWSLLPGAIKYDNPKVQTSPQDSMAEVFARIDSIDQEIESYKKKAGYKTIEISNYIEKHVFDDNEKTVLTAYFIGGSTINKISTSISYSIRQTYRYLNHGIDTISRALDDGKDVTNGTR